MTPPISAIGDVVLPVAGWNPQSSDRVEFTYIDIASVDRETKSVVGAARLKCSDAPSRARQLVQTGDILVSTVRPGLNAVAVVPQEHDGATASTGFTVLRPNHQRVVGAYLFHWLRTPAFVRDMVKVATGASYPAVSDRIVLASTFPLPPLPEQRRIANILDRADAIRRKRKEAIALTEELLRSAFLEMFGDPVTNPKGWTVKPLGDVCEFRTGKLDSNAAVEGGQYPFFTCSRETSSIDRYAFDCEALLLAGNNATADYSVKRYAGRFNAYQRTYVITLRTKGSAYGYWRQALQMKLQELKRSSKGTNTKYLTLGILEPLKVLVPSEELQRSYDHVDAAVAVLRGRLVRASRECEVLFESLVQRAFSCELSLGRGKAQLGLLADGARDVRT